MEIYRKLQKHLDSMPIPYPSSSSGREIELLKRFFSESQAEIALFMDFKMRTVSDISKRSNIADKSLLRSELAGMLSRGGVLYREEGEMYSLVPLIVGMYEFQVNKLSSEFLSTAFAYMKEKFAFHFLTSSRAQTRILPMNIEIENKNKISTYDEYEEMIRSAGDRIVVIECICRKVCDMEGNPCEISDRRELCLALRDYADTAIREEWGRQISVEEALEISEQNRKDGFVLQSANDKNPNFICACCSDCCGLLNMIKSVPCPAEYVESNFICSINDNLCKSCGLCIKRCPMDALKIKDKKLVLDKSRCIGCGVCIDSCNFKALTLKEKENHREPPEDVEELYDEIEGKKSYSKKVKLIVRYILMKLKIMS